MLLLDLAMFGKIFVSGIYQNQMDGCTKTRSSLKSVYDSTAPESLREIF